MSYLQRRMNRVWLDEGRRRGRQFVELKGRGRFMSLDPRKFAGLGYRPDEIRPTLADGESGLYYHHVITKGIGIMKPIEVDALLYYSEWGSRDSDNIIVVRYHRLRSTKIASEDSKRAHDEFKKTLNAFIKEWEKRIPENPISDDLEDAFEKASGKAGLDVE